MKPRSLIPVLVICAGLFIAASFAGVTFCYFAANATSGANAATAWTSATWTETTTADFNAGLPLQVNTTGDQVTLARTASGPYVYALRGGGQTAFWRYDVAANTWSVMSPVPAGIGAGGALAYTGGDFIYALRGGGTRDFYRVQHRGEYLECDDPDAVRDRCRRRPRVRRDVRVRAAGRGL